MPFFYTKDLKSDALEFKKEEKEILFQELFFCPKCDTQRPYEVRSASVDFTFYFIPLFEKRNVDHFVVCQVCKKGFDPKILALGHQSLFKLVWAKKCELLHFSPEALKSKLAGKGLKEEFINKLMTLAQN